MLTKSAKAKGRALQNLVRDLVKKYWGIVAKVRIMGEKGDDVYIEGSWQFYIECKNREKLSPWKHFQETQEKAGNKFPLLIIKKNGEKPLAIMDLNDFFDFSKQTEGL